MDSNGWAARLSSSPRSYKSTVQSRSGTKSDGFDTEMFLGLEEIEIGDDMREEYICPFCSEYFNIVGLCCHIDDEHPVEATNGVCPVCSMRVGEDMVAHITLQHGNIFKMQHKRKLRKASSHSALSLLRRGLREGTLQSLFGGLAPIVSSCNTVPDPLLSSFIVPMIEEFETAPSNSSLELLPAKSKTTDSNAEREVLQPSLSFEDKEKSNWCDFVQGLLLSMLLDDNL